MATRLPRLLLALVLVTLSLFAGGSSPTTSSVNAQEIVGTSPETLPHPQILDTADPLPSLLLSPPTASAEGSRSPASRRPDDTLPRWSTLLAIAGPKSSVTDPSGDLKPLTWLYAWPPMHHAIISGNTASVDLLDTVIGSPPGFYWYARTLQLEPYASQDTVPDQYVVAWLAGEEWEESDPDDYSLASHLDLTKVAVRPGGPGQIRFIWQTRGDIMDQQNVGYTFGLNPLYAATGVPYWNIWLYRYASGSWMWAINARIGFPSWKSEPYEDITAASVTDIGGGWLRFSLNTAGAIPANPDSSRPGYAWRLDTDNNLATGQNGSDYRVEVYYDRSVWKADVQRWSASRDKYETVSEITFSMTGMTVTAQVRNADIGTPASFRWQGGALAEFGPSDYRLYDWVDYAPDAGWVEMTLLPPAISNIHDSPDPINRQGCPAPTTVTVQADVTASSTLAWVRLNYQAPGGSWTETAMSKTSGNTYTATIGPFSQTGTLNYYVKARDDAGLESSSATATVTVQDCYPPTISNVHAVPNPINLQGCPAPNAVTVQADVTASSAMDSVRLSYQAPGGYWTETAMSKTSGNTYAATIGPFSQAGTLSYYVKARDSAGLEARSDTGSLTVKDCYSIRGRVRQVGSEQPIQGVAITYGMGQAAITGSNGEYTISGLVPGSYVLTPNKQCYTFDPSSFSVYLTANKQDVDFWATPPPCDCNKQPLLLVHGWGGDNVLANDDSGFAQLYPYLQQDGYVEGCNLWWAQDVRASNSIMDNRRGIQNTLRSAANTLNTTNPNWGGHFDIIAHSYGGINARYYLESHLSPNYEEDRNYDAHGIHIDNLFTLGTPHGGVKLFNELYPGAGLIGVGVNAKQLSWGTALSTALLLDGLRAMYNVANEQPDDVCYRLIGGNFLNQPHDTVTDWLRGIYQWMPPGDTGVSLRSSLNLGEARFALLYPHVVALANSDMHGYFETYGFGPLRSYVRPEDTYLSSIKPFIGKTIDQCQRVGAPSVASEVALPLLIASGTVGPSGVVNDTLPVDWTGQSAFYVNWGGVPIALTLRDPSGAEITPGTVVGSSNVIYDDWTSAAGGMAAYAITDTLRGQWTYTVTNPDPSESSVFELLATFQSSLGLQATVPEWQRADQPVVISASVRNTSTALASHSATGDASILAGTTLQASVTDPSGNMSTVLLHDDGQPPDAAAGDGIAAGSYGATAQGGVYTVLITGAGTNAGVPFRRSFQTVFMVGGDDARLTGDYREQPGDDGVGAQYQPLDVYAQVQVTRPGEYALTAVLKGRGGEPIDVATTAVALPVGTTEVRLRFSGQAIYRSRTNGPYSIAEVLLVDNQSFIKLDSVEQGWVTGPYDYHVFGSDRLYLPLLQRR